VRSWVGVRSILTIDLVVVGHVPHVRHISCAFLVEQPSVPDARNREYLAKREPKLSKSREDRWEGNSEVSVGTCGNLRDRTAQLINNLMVWAHILRTRMEVLVCEMKVTNSWNTVVIPSDPMADERRWKFDVAVGGWRTLILLVRLRKSKYHIHWSFRAHLSHATPLSTTQHP
jgi:hypothetical protein